jgi:hypothetical protein
MAPCAMKGRTLILALGLLAPGLAAAQQVLDPLRFEAVLIAGAPARRAAWVEPISRT